ncbi:hypothetical protein [Streptomyces sp. NPDC003719]
MKWFIPDGESWVNQHEVHELLGVAEGGEVARVLDQRELPVQACTSSENRLARSVG